MADSYNELFGLGTWSIDSAMQGWWRLQETTGTTAVDSSGKGRNGTLVNFGSNPVTTAGPNSWLSSTYRFNGSNQRINLGDYRSDFTNAVTVLAFVRATASKVFPMAVSTAGAGGDGNEGFELRGGNNNNLMQFNVDESTGRPAPSSVTSTLNVWSHVAGTYNGSSVVMYDDGVSASVSGSGNIAFGPASTWRIGDRGGGVGLPWQGDICDVVLFNRALTAAEVAEHRFGPEPLNTVAPVISGSTSVGSVLTTTTGTWNSQSNGTLTFTYQWTRDGANISGATSSTYTTVSGDLGAAIRCRVRATNDGGFDAAQDTVSNSISVSGGGAFTLTADSGTFSLSGQNTTLAANRVLTADQSTFTTTGQTANLLRSRLLTTDQATFATSGQDATLKASRLLTADQATYTLSGQDVALVSGNTLTAENATLTLAGQTASFVLSTRITADQAAFTLSGQDASLTYSGATSEVPYLEIDFVSGNRATGTLTTLAATGSISVIQATGTLVVSEAES